jgi:pyruvate/2-oxoglutarate dehydrogenase complex dihydrolipoamide dehydrogenase (E3) component
VQERARFRNAHTLTLASGREIEAHHIVVACGSRVAPPPFAGLGEVGYLTSDTALELKRLPKSLLILGGGAVGLEFAQFFCRFGVEVTLIQRSARVLSALDPDGTAVIEAVLRREGVQIYVGTRLLKARRIGDVKEVEFEQGEGRHKVMAEEILFALGRVPNTAGLGLEEIGVKLEAGWVVTDSRQRSSVPHIFAAGDCAGPFEIVHLAVLQGEVAGYAIAEPQRDRRMDYRLGMEIIFTDPQIAVVGLTEREAARRGVDFVAASHPFGDHGKSMIMETLDGFVKLLADPVTGEILGGACVGPMGGELIHEITAAMHKRMTVGELAAMPHYHPTLAEIWSYPAEELAARVAPGRK